GATTCGSRQARPTSCTFDDADSLTPRREPRAGARVAAAPLVRGRPGLVQEGGLLRDPHPRLPRRLRRRQRRLPGPGREARLPAVARDQLHLAAADVPVAAPGRWLRHQRLLL